MRLTGCAESTSDDEAGFAVCAAVYVAEEVEGIER